jgi:uncharacterized protein (DUF1330 family)
MSGTKKGYWMGMVDVTDPDNYPQYLAANKAVLEQYGARFIVRGGQCQVFEGAPATRLVIIEFDSYQTALDCYHSPDYQVALKVRHAYSNAHFAIVEGV